MRHRLASIPLLLLLVAAPVVAQEPPGAPSAVGTVAVSLHVEPYGTPLPPDGTYGAALLSAQVRCTQVVVQTEPIRITLAYTGSQVATDVAFDPEVLEFQWQHPACVEGDAMELQSTVSFRLRDALAYREPVGLAAVASSEHMEEDVEVTWTETVGFTGTATAAIEPRIPVRTNARNEVVVRVDNEANGPVRYTVALERDFPLAAEVLTPAERVVGGRFDRDPGDLAVVSFVPEAEGDAALVLAVEFRGPDDEALGRQLVSTTIVSHPDHDAAVAPRGNDAPGPGALAATAALAAVAVALARRARAAPNA